MKNYYFDSTKELHPYTHQLDINANTLAPDNALRIAPIFKTGFHPCERDGKWVLIEDNRGKNAYSIKTKEVVKIDYLGKIKDGYTLQEPFEFSKWDGEKWILDDNEKNTYITKQNKLLKDELLNTANKKIDVLTAIINDMIELGMQPHNESDQINKWKKYRIKLNSVDSAELNIKWPEQPNI